MHNNIPARPPLTPAQQELALSAKWWMWQEVDRTYEWFRRVVGIEVVKQEMWVAVCKAAADWNPVLYPGVPFGAFARQGIRLHFKGLVEDVSKKRNVWREMPAKKDRDFFFHNADACPKWAYEVGELNFLDPPDTRRVEAEPLLKAWCSPDYTEARRCLPMRWRVILCLRYVECWTLREVAAAIKTSPERVRQIESNATARLARQRDRQLARKGKR